MGFRSNNDGDIVGESLPLIPAGSRVPEAMGDLYRSLTREEIDQRLKQIRERRHYQDNPPDNAQN